LILPSFIYLAVSAPRSVELDKGWFGSQDLSLFRKNSEHRPKTLDHQISQKCCQFDICLTDKCNVVSKRTSSKLSGVKTWTLSARTVAVNDRNEAMVARTKFFRNMFFCASIEECGQGSKRGKRVNKRRVLKRTREKRERKRREGDSKM